MAAVISTTEAACCEEPGGEVGGDLVDRVGRRGDLDRAVLDLLGELRQRPAGAAASPRQARPAAPRLCSRSAPGRPPRGARTPRPGRARGPARAPPRAASRPRPGAPGDRWRRRSRRPPRPRRTPGRRGGPGGTAATPPPATGSTAPATRASPTTRIQPEGAVAVGVRSRSAALRRDAIDQLADQNPSPLCRRASRAPWATARRQAARACRFQPSTKLEARRRIGNSSPRRNRTARRPPSATLDAVQSYGYSFAISSSDA